MWYMNISDSEFDHFAAQCLVLPCGIVHWSTDVKSDDCKANS